MRRRLSSGRDDVVLKACRRKPPAHFASVDLSPAATAAPRSSRTSGVSFCSASSGAPARARVPHRDRRRAQVRLPRADAASCRVAARPPAACELAARGGRFGGVDAGCGTDPSDEECGGTCSRVRASTHVPHRLARSGFPRAARASPRDPGRARGRGQGTAARPRVAIAQGEVAFREQEPPGGVRRRCSCVIEGASSRRARCRLPGPVIVDARQTVPGKAAPPCSTARQSRRAASNSPSSNATFARCRRAPASFGSASIARLSSCRALAIHAVVVRGRPLRRATAASRPAAPSRARPAPVRGRNSGRRASCARAAAMPRRRRRRVPGPRHRQASPAPATRRPAAPARPRRRRPGGVARSPRRRRRKRKGRRPRPMPRPSLACGEKRAGPGLSFRIPGTAS